METVETEGAKGVLMAGVASAVVTAAVAKVGASAAAEEKVVL